MDLDLNDLLLNYNVKYVINKQTCIPKIFSNKPDQFFKFFFLVKFWFILRHLITIITFHFIKIK